MSDRLRDEQPRRTFFQEALRRMIRPVADYVERRFDLRSDRVRLRPPGAIDESALVDTCQRCGSCVAICPARAIFPLDQGAGEAAGTPVIDPDQAACVVCDGLLCTTVCPSGALRALAHPGEIRMGLAEVYEPLCVRSSGESCTVCVERCPIGVAALRFDGEGPPRVLAAGCVGCGVCQLHCPTSPKAIVVRPC